MAPPAETGTTMVMGWAGKVCAAALCSPAERAAAEAAKAQQLAAVKLHRVSPQGNFEAS
jgi:hypothetical protein